MPCCKRRPWQRDSNQTVSGKPGTVQAGWRRGQRDGGSRWWVPVWTVFGRSLGAGFLVFLVFFALALISGGGGMGMGDVKLSVSIGLMC